ncbi:hypothetical protein BDFB_008511 [Asbolus verrucosus]|uniref:Uncharacterized protein n=1 Tax=Asbolus verrucosus TaxID=1661398 RepID=A0A482V2E2_ASBVE|nr:hypothetical protein BDFB_008511 [Asbolus verrucosus]
MHHYIKCSCYQNYYTLIKSVSAVRPVTIALQPDSSLPGNTCVVYHPAASSDATTCLGTPPLLPDGIFLTRPEFTPPMHTR